jgi:putative addiction module CopG family antidote
MAKRVALNVSLTAELASFVRGQVASGSYGSASEVVRASLRLLIEADAADTRNPRTLNQQQDPQGQ